MPSQEGRNAASYGIEIDRKASSGEFYFDVRGQRTTSAGPSSKFDALLWLGQLPDTNILSNRLIKMIGQHVLDLIADKSRYHSYFSFVQHKRERAEELFDELELKSLWHCWRLIAKLRALQDIDYLFNHHSLLPMEVYTRIQFAKNALAALLPEPPDSQEAQELQFLILSLDQLGSELQNAHSIFDRNALLQNWQQKEFRQLVANFQAQQGAISAEQHDILPRENVANTKVTREAEVILQNWEYGELGTIHDTMLFREEEGEVFYSGNYAELDKRNLLYASMLGGELGANLGLDPNQEASFQILNQKNADGKFCLHALRDDYDNLCEEIRTTTIDIKLAREQDPNPAVEEELEQRSRLMSEWWELWSTPVNQQLHLQQALSQIQTEKAEPPVELAPTSVPDTNPAVDPELSTPLADALSNGSLKPTRAAEYQYVFTPGDALTASLRFLTDFSGYFDQMMDKHPFIATAFFSIPYLQFGGIGLAMSGNTSLLPVANFFATLEAQMSGGKITATQINHIIGVVDKAVLWFTSAESALQVLITCGFTISKVSYTIVDVVVNELFNKVDETTLSELARKLDPTSTLEGNTTRETIRHTLTGVISGLLLLTVAGSIGVAADVCESAVLEFFAHVPASLITSPSIQTLGALKTSGLLIGKLAGINNYISKEQLVDTQGLHLTQQSPEYKLLILFAKLCSGYEKVSEQQRASAPFQQALYSFEKLLTLNPDLIKLYGKKPLRELGVTQRSSSWYQRLPMACLKSVAYALLFIPSFLAHTYYAFRGKAVPPMWKLSLVIPLNWVVLTGKILWTTAKAMIHGFVQVAARIPEVLAQLSFVALRLATTILSYLSVALAYGLKGLGRLFGYSVSFNPSNNPVAHFFNQVLLAGLHKIQVAVVTGIRQYFRYPLEQWLGAFLKLCRDILVRIPEQALQQAFISTEAQPQLEAAPIESLSLSAQIQQVMQSQRSTETARTSLSSTSDGFTQSATALSLLFKSKNVDHNAGTPLSVISQPGATDQEKREGREPIDLNRLGQAGGRSPATL